MQIDQKPEDYRVQRADGSWTQRVNKPLCRWLSIVSLAFAAWLALSAGGDTTTIAFACAAMAFAAGALLTLSLKSIDW